MSAAINLDALERQLTQHEGLRLHPYADTKGKLTIGVGRNLTDVGISPDEAKALLQADIARALAGLDAELPWWRDLDEVRQRVIADMAFNMGLGHRATASEPARGLLSFERTLIALKTGRYFDAAVQMRRSEWHRETGARAERLALMVETGKDQPL